MVALTDTVFIYKNYTLRDGGKSIKCLLFVEMRGIISDAWGDLLGGDIELGIRKGRKYL